MQLHELLMLLHHQAHNTYEYKAAILFKTTLCFCKEDDVIAKDTTGSDSIQLEALPDDWKRFSTPV